MSILQSALSAIFDNCADVIEGGNSYRGSGTAYKGVAGLSSNDVEGEAVSVTLANQAHATTSLVTTGATISGYTRDATNANRYATADLPPWFALCSSGATGNPGAARKITAWGASAITLGVALPATPGNGDVFALRHGFKRMRDNVDIEADGQSGDGFDRMFHLTAGAGERLPMYGNQTETYRTSLELRLRFLKRARAHRVVDSAMENLLILRSVLTRPSHRDGTYMQSLTAEGSAPSIVREDATKIVVRDSLTLIYRVNAEYL